MVVTRSSQRRSGSAPSKKRHKYIFVIGGVMSGVGKGIATSSIGLILQSKGYKVNAVKIDPYLNVDAGTMNPTEHGEVFVLSSGLETDQDMGNYERFLNTSLAPEDYMTSGMVYQHVLNRERNLGYGGRCVEAIPHVRDEIIRRIRLATDQNGSDISVIEIGGTVGDFQNALFIEAARVMKLEHPDDVVFVLVSYLPIPGNLGEMKTRPTQNAVHQLNSYGVQASFVVARSAQPLDQKRKEKIAISCNVTPEHIISAPDVDSIYDVPLNFEKEHIGDMLLKTLHLPKKAAKGLREWGHFVSKVRTAKKELSIAIVGKYFDTGDFVLSDAYLSVIEAIKYSAAEVGAKAKITWVNAKDFEKNASSVSLLADFDGILVPGGFGETGIEGKIRAIQYAREHKIPYFGLCYGMQLLLVEYARNVLGLAGSHTTEIDSDTTHPVIDVMPEQKDIIAKADYGGTMRLGTYPAKLKKGTIAREAYGTDEIEERHRHRYEVNPAYVKNFEEGGIVFSGVSPSGVLMEIAELPKDVHPFMMGTQFHPELQARPLAPHPLFTAFLKACVAQHARR
ncbi:CTP synthase [Candidatus Kaiserbacteria bacterium RIFCSPHIGHO2_01_FULL_48_10]|uniref:CTP synthase n=1 Tax=Candidatus Kaiserbacteria bacterium RIFCSPHIGHO2_01_FULL_48_10 TaxID=1798476 RepID=A0A1F6C308_9BACT|nr:MAG: CTP synthase [Candidatus Kaiserbacteria bacterium RIFCSPHIGHO2_01_FULL_48_10]